MDRKMYEPTAGNEKKWARYTPVEMPSDEEFKGRWARAHHGKERGWGMGKRTWVVGHMTLTREYQMGLWQGRVDAARETGYSEERNENTYNLGYNRGYTEYESSRRGWDSAMRARFDEQYTNA